MAKNKTVPEGLAESVEHVVGRIRVTAKLQGLATLVDRLRSEQPERWRLVVFKREVIRMGPDRYREVGL